MLKQFELEEATSLGDCTAPYILVLVLTTLVILGLFVFVAAAYMLARS